MWSYTDADDLADAIVLAVESDASGISCAEAERLLGYRPTRSWRDHLDDQGRPPGLRSCTDE